jgi:hypothetical protein
MCRKILLSLIDPMTREDNGQMRRLSPLAFFSIGALVDFVYGLVKWHSLLAGVVAIVCGLPLTGLLFLAFGASWKGNDDSA